MTATSNLPPAHRFGRAIRILLSFAGVDRDTIARCPKADMGTASASALLALLVAAYQATLLSFVSEMLFAPPHEIKPGPIAGALLFAVLILCIDSVIILRASWHTEGLNQLAHYAGLDLRGGLISRLLSAILIGMRLLLAVGLAQLFAVLLAVGIFAPDIAARLHGQYLKANERLEQPAEALVDENIRRATASVNGQATSVDALASQLTKLRQQAIDPNSADGQVAAAEAEVNQLLGDRSNADAAVQAAASFAIDERGGIKRTLTNSGAAGMGPRYRAALAQQESAKRYANEIEHRLADARTRLERLRAQGSLASGTVMRESRDQIATAERALKEGQAKLERMNADLMALVRGREVGIQRALEASPNYVPLQTGILARLTALDEITKENGKIALIVLLLDAVAMGIELTGAIGKVFFHLPSTYALLIVRETILTSGRVADEIIAERGAADVPPPSPPEEQPTVASAPLDAPSEPLQPPAKRGRGRPRKHPLPTPVKPANGQAGPGPSSAPPKLS